jgi:hypothetical protein
VSSPYDMPALGWAERYVALGWSPVPLSTAVECAAGDCKQESCAADDRNHGKHPRVSWRESHLPDPVTLDQVREWWGRWPSAGVGLLTGWRSGVDVIDVDPGNGGAYQALRDTHPGIPEEPTARSGGGGQHLFIRHPGVRTSNGMAALIGLPGVDYRGDGGMIVVAPTMHRSGNRYEFTRLPPTEPVHLPWLEDKAKARAEEERGKAEEAARLHAHLRDKPRGTPDDGQATPTGRNMTRVAVGKVLDSAARSGHATEGRHSTVIKQARWLGGLIPTGHVSADYAARALLEAAVVVKGANSEAEMREAIAWGIDAGEAWPWEPEDKPLPATTITSLSSVAEEAARAAAAPPDQGAEQDTTAAPTPALEFVAFGALAARVDARGPRQWLLRGVWPHGDYGIHHAAPKAQKSWTTVDLAVAVASGTPWLGHVEVDTPGPVVIFWGEGGEGNIVRRIRACAAARDLVAEELPIYVCPRAPHLGSADHLGEMADAIARINPALVILDPLYLAAKGAKLGDVYAMGDMLEAPQRICQAVGASLWVVHHDNRGDAKGAMRASGAGPAEWGRVIVSATVKARHTDPDTSRTDVVTVLDVIGGEVPDTTLRVTRRVWAADPDDLSSALHVETTVEAGDAATSTSSGSDLKPAEQKLYEAVKALGPGQWTSSQLVDWIADKHGHGLRRETASRCLNHLAELDLVDAIEQPNGRPTLWFLPEGTRDQPVIGPVTSQVPETRDVTRDVTGVGTRDLPVIHPVGDHGSRVTGHGSQVEAEITGHAPHPNHVPL